MANAAKVREVVQYIETTMMKNQRMAFHMASWSQGLGPKSLLNLRPEVADTEDESLRLDIEQGQPHCGTSMCLAGWAEDMDLYNSNIPRDAFRDSFAAGAGVHVMELEGKEALIFFDYSIQTIQDLKAACNGWFNDEIFEPDEYVGSKWNGSRAIPDVLCDIRQNPGGIDRRIEDNSYNATRYVQAKREWERWFAEQGREAV